LPGLASVNVCEQPEDSSHLSLGYYEQEEAFVSQGIERTEQQLHEFDAHFSLGDSWSVGMGYRYLVLGLDPNALQTNGHLHTMFFPIHRQSSQGDNSFRISVAPAKSASSNIIKNLDQYTSDAFQLLGAAVWRRALSEQSVLRYGLCVDSRLGSYRVYPTLGVDWHPNRDVRVELGFPTSRLSYALSETVSSSLQVEPAGNEWHVRSADFARSSDVEFEATLVEWTISWELREGLSLTASIGRLFDSWFEATLPDDRRVRASAEDATRLGAAIAWRW
jgi:hypothetical protein